MRHDSRTAMTCHEYLHKKFAPNRFALGAPSELSAMAKELSRQGHEHEARVFETIKTACSKWVHIDSDDDKYQREAQTVAALFNPEIDIILGANFLCRYSWQVIAARESSFIASVYLRTRVFLWQK